MTTYFEAPDGHGESTIWTRDPDDPGHAPMPVICELDVTTSYWRDVVARMTGTVVTNDDATVQRVMQVLSEQGGDAGSGLHSWRCEYPERYGKCDCLDEAARAVLAALTGVPHD